MHIYAENTSGRTHKKLKVVVPSGEGNLETGVKRCLTFQYYFCVPFNFIILSTCYLFKTTKITTVPRPLGLLSQNF